MPEDLPEGYYLKNFEYLVQFVSDRYDHLLNEEEKDYRKTISRLTEDQKKLYVRLTNRKGPFFRLDKLSYPEIPNLSEAITALASVQLIRFGSPDFETSVSLCSRDELLQLSQFSCRPASMRRSELIEVLDPESDPLVELSIPVFELLGTQALLVYRLLFFGNFHQNMTEFVLHELVTPYESYELTGTAAFFTDRESVEQLIHLQTLSEMSRDVIEVDTNGQMILALTAELPERPHEATLSRRYDRIVNRLARQLERLERLGDALALYEFSRAAPSRERRARLLDKLAQPAASLRLCEAIKASALDEAELTFAINFGSRLAKKYRLETSLPAQKRFKTSAGLIKVAQTSGRVEVCAVDFYNKTEGLCYYVENTLFRGLFGLAFWDVIFAPVSGAFFHPFQRGPADLYTSDFLAARRELIAERRGTLSKAGCLREIVLMYFREKKGIANQFVNWSYLSEELLELALARIPIRDMQLIFDRLLLDLKHNCSGLPDLILFMTSGYKLIEIKGPGDSIQKNQERWFRYFQQHDIPAELVNVEYSE